jgi:hypothetical protein
MQIPNLLVAFPQKMRMIDPLLFNLEVVAGRSANRAESLSAEWFLFFIRKSR